MSLVEPSPSHPPFCRPSIICRHLSPLYNTRCTPVAFSCFSLWRELGPSCLPLVTLPNINFSPGTDSISSRKDYSSPSHTPRTYNLAGEDYISLSYALHPSSVLFEPTHSPSLPFHPITPHLPSSSWNMASSSGLLNPPSSTPSEVCFSKLAFPTLQPTLAILFVEAAPLGLSRLVSLGSSFKSVEIGLVMPTRNT